MNPANCIQKIKKISLWLQKEWHGIPRVFLLIFLVVYVPLWVSTTGVSRPIFEQGYSKYFQLPVVASDSYEYQNLAENIIERQSFVFERGGKTLPEVFRTPGYSVLVACIEFIFTSPFAVTFIQIILVLVIAVLMRRLADEILQGSGVWAGTVFMLLPGTLFHSLIILSDVAFVCGLMSVVYILRSEYSYTRIIVSSGIVGILTYIRPIAQFLGPSIAIFILIDVCRRGYCRRALLYSVIMVVIPLIMMLPWMYRNYHATGVFGFSSVTSYNSLTYNIGGAWKDGSKVYSAVGLSSQDEAFLLQNSGKIKAYVAHEFLQHPWGYIKYHFSATPSFFFSTGLNVWNVTLTHYMRDLDRTEPIIIKFEKLFWIIIFFAFFAGSYKYRNERVIHIGLCLAAYFWILTGPVAYARYRMPVEPFLLIVSVCLLYSFYKSRNNT